MTKKTISKKVITKKATRVYTKQEDVPNFSLREALKIPKIIFDNYAGSPTVPLKIAKELKMEPGGSQFIMMTGSAIAFGLTSGGAQASTISVTDISKRIFKPLSEESPQIARLEALLKPKIYRDFLTKYDKSALPRDKTEKNFTEEMGVSSSKQKKVFQNILEGATDLNLITEINGKKYIDLSDTENKSAAGKPSLVGQREQSVSLIDSDINIGNTELENSKDINALSKTNALEIESRKKKVFITHGKDMALVETIKKLLQYGELTPIVSVEKQSTSQPISEKVLGEMRSAGAAIIHVNSEGTHFDADGVADNSFINPNVLIEIGVALAIYDRRFILLVKDELKLPSNLTGMYEIRYKSDSLDAGETIKLLEAIKVMKELPLPS